MILPTTHIICSSLSLPSYGIISVVMSQKHRLAAFPAEKKEVVLNGSLMRNICTELVWQLQTTSDIPNESKSSASSSLVFLALHQFIHQGNRLNKQPHIYSQSFTYVKVCIISNFSFI